MMPRVGIERDAVDEVVVETALEGVDSRVEVGCVALVWSTPNFKQQADGRKTFSPTRTPSAAIVKIASVAETWIALSGAFP